MLKYGADAQRPMGPESEIHVVSAIGTCLQHLDATKGNSNCLS